jgi:flagellar hook-length control protein FliK
MNVSLPAQAAGTTHGAHAKAGKTGDPLADFMALLGQLGISLEGDGTLATQDSVPTTGKGAQDIAARLLAKLGKRVGDTLPEARSDTAPDLKGEDAGGKGDEKADDAVATLAALLAQLDSKHSQSEPVKLDIATLLAAVRAFASSDAKGKPAESAVVSTVDSKTRPVASSSAPSIASLLARTTPADRENKVDVPAAGKVQATFARLEALVESKSAEFKANGRQGDEKQPVANDESASEAAAAGQPIESPKAASAAKLTELLARLTDSTKPGAGQPSASATIPAAVHARSPRIDPQIAAITQAIQRQVHDDKAVNSPASQPVVDAAPGLLANAPPAPATPAMAAPAAPAMAAPADVVSVSASEELVTHHLDLGRDTQWLDTLSRDIARAAQSDTQLRFQLNPEHLGTLKVELLNGAHGTSVKLTAETEAARAILADAQPRLVAEARAQGLRISEAQVNLGGHGGGQRHMAETPVAIRTASGAAVAEVQQDVPAGSGERYA